MGITACWMKIQNAQKDNLYLFTGFSVKTNVTYAVWGDS